MPPRNDIYSLKNTGKEKGQSISFNSSVKLHPSGSCSSCRWYRVFMVQCVLATRLCLKKEAERLLNETIKTLSKTLKREW